MEYEEQTDSMNANSNNNEENSLDNQEFRFSKNRMIPAFFLAIFFPTTGAIVLLIIGMITDMEISRIFIPLITFPFCLLAIIIIYPKKLKAPFGKIDASKFARNIGLYIPSNIGAHILLGILLALCSLSGMLIGSIITGRYEFDINQLELTQVIFATAPGVWEEVFYRGIMMFVLMRWLKDLRKAIVIQSVVFGLSHISAFDLWSLVDIFSIILMGLVFSYVAYKSNSLIPSIIFHYLHDAFLFLVQNPGGNYSGIAEHSAFYLSLWGMLGVGCLITMFITKKTNLFEQESLYDFSKIGIQKIDRQKQTTKMHETLLEDNL